MTPKQVVQKALRHEETACVPYQIDVTPPVRRQLELHYRTDDIAGAMGDYVAIVGAGTDKPLYASPDEMGEFARDEFGVLWKTSADDRGYAHDRPLKSPSLEGYAFPDPLRPGRFDEVGPAVDRNRERFVLGVAGDLFERAHLMRGLEHMLMDFLLHPAFAHELLEQICDYDLKTLVRMAELGVDGIFISDDYGLQRSLMMRPDTWREFIKPQLARLISASKALGLPTVLHSCGRVVDIIPDLIEIGLDVLHPIQPEAMDVWRLKREFGRDISFFGGIGTQQLLRAGTPDEVTRAVHKAKSVLGARGGYILGPSITIQRDCPIENVLALIEAARLPL